MDFSRLLVIGVEVDADERLRLEVLLLLDFSFEFSSFPALFFFFFLDLAFFSVYLKDVQCFINLQKKRLLCYLTDGLGTLRASSFINSNIEFNSGRKKGFCPLTRETKSS